jgi:hypothetical protein
MQLTTYICAKSSLRPSIPQGSRCVIDAYIAILPFTSSFSEGIPTKEEMIQVFTKGIIDQGRDVRNPFHGQCKRVE